MLQGDRNVICRTQQVSLQKMCAEKLVDVETESLRIENGREKQGTQSMESVVSRKHLAAELTLCVD
jgi:hypothetical protein